MADRITWKKVQDWNRVQGWVREVHVTTLEWSTAGHWRVRPVFPAPAAPLAAKYSDRGSAKAAAEDWWRHALDSLNAQPKMPDPGPGQLEELVKQIREVVLRQEGLEAETLRRRAEDAVSYMDQVFSPSQITLEHIRRILKGEE